MKLLDLCLLSIIHLHLLVPSRGFGLAAGFLLFTFFFKPLRRVVAGSGTLCWNTGWVPLFLSPLDFESFICSPLRLICSEFDNAGDAEFWVLLAELLGIWKVISKGERKNTGEEGSFGFFAFYPALLSQVRLLHEQQLALCDMFFIVYLKPIWKVSFSIWNLHSNFLSLSFIVYRLFNNMKLLIGYAFKHYEQVRITLLLCGCCSYSFRLNSLLV